MSIPSLHHGRAADERFDVPILVWHRGQADAYASWLREQGCVQVFAATSAAQAESILDAQRPPVVLGAGVAVPVLAQAGCVRWVQAMSAGVDGILRQGKWPPEIALTRLVDVFSRQMAEHIFAALLLVVKDTPRWLRQQAQHQWAPFDADAVAGLTIGVAGLGSIGKEVVRKARAFDMTVFGLSRSGRAAADVDRHFYPSQWHQFAALVDVLVVNLPATPQTQHVVDAQTLAAMKSGAILVNVGRGSAVDEAALVLALQQGKLRAALLDVFEQEPLPIDSPLWELPGVVLTPHMSGLSSADNVGPFFLRNLSHFVASRPLEGLVDPQLQY